MKIYRRAWLGSRALDYMLTRSDVNPSIVRPHRLNWEQGSCLRCSHNLHLHSPVCQQVSITGHSRNGKQSLIAAAFDERITAVVGSSPGMPIASPIRFSSPQYQGETLGATAGCSSRIFHVERLSGFGTVHHTDPSLPPATFIFIPSRDSLTAACRAACSVYECRSGMVETLVGRVSWARE